MLDVLKFKGNQCDGIVFLERRRLSVNLSKNKKISTLIGFNKSLRINVGFLGLLFLIEGSIKK